MKQPMDWTVYMDPHGAAMWGVRTRTCTHRAPAQLSCTSGATPPTAEVVACVIFAAQLDVLSFKDNGLLAFGGLAGCVFVRPRTSARSTLYA